MMIHLLELPQKNRTSSPPKETTPKRGHPSVEAFSQDMPGPGDFPASSMHHSGLHIAYVDEIDTRNPMLQFRH
jgi:hypothetical protein